MKLFKKMKDGGRHSRVFGYFAIEWKRMFSVVLLHFLNGSREAYHTHAFHALSWVLRGQLTEFVDGEVFNVYRPSWRPVWTPRERFHKVSSTGDTWVLSFRGPWVDRWREFIPAENRQLVLTHGRKEVA